MAIALDTLVYARRLREAGFSEQQAEGQAEALAAVMTDTLATKQDLAEVRHEMRDRFAAVDARFALIDARFDSLERHMDTRIDELEKRIAIRFSEQKSDYRRELADLERRMTLRLGGMMVSCFGLFTALDRLI